MKFRWSMVGSLQEPCLTDLAATNRALRPEWWERRRYRVAGLAVLWVIVFLGSIGVF